MRDPPPKGAKIILMDCGKAIAIDNLRGRRAHGTGNQQTITKSRDSAAARKKASCGGVDAI